MPVIASTTLPEIVPPLTNSAPPIVASPPTNDFAELLKRIEKLEQQKSATKLPTVNWTAQLQADTLFFSQDQIHQDRFGETLGGSAFRRARIGMLGDYGPASYRIEMDFALPGRPSFLDVYAAIKDIPYLGMLRVGHFFEPFSLERATANRYVTFLERSLIDEAFAPARNLGIMARNAYFEERATYAIGVFGTDSDNFGDSVGSPRGLAVTTRATCLPYFDEVTEGHFWHLGMAYSFREAKNGEVRFRARPEMRIGSATPNIPFVADTKTFRADYYQLIGFESALIHGPFAVQAECTIVPVTTPQNGTQNFFGAYIEGTWLLTGEHRRYRKDNGTMDRLIPDRNFVGTEADSFGSGPGAIELAIRLSHLDLDDGPIRGNQVSDITAGVNWYLNPYLRVTANYIHSSVNPRRGATGQSDGFGMRLGWEF